MTSHHKKPRPRPQAVPPAPKINSRLKKKEPPSQPLPAELNKRRGYSLLRLLMIINAAGPNGITTRKLLDTIGSHSGYHQKVLNNAFNHDLINRVGGEPPGPGQFVPVYNIITPKGRQLLLQDLGILNNRSSNNNNREESDS